MTDQEVIGIEEELLRVDRIRKEDEALAANPKQRERVVLDYLRRGSLKDGLNLMPDLVDIAPLLLESGLIDFATEDFDAKATWERIIAVFSAIESELTTEDQMVRELLERHGLTPKDNGRKIIDAAWFAKVQKVFADFKLPQKDRDTRSPEAFRDGKLRKLNNDLAVLVTGSPDDLISTVESNPQILELTLPHQNAEDPVKNFIYKNRPVNGFRIFPKLSEYKGEIVEAPPEFADQEPKPGLHMIERDTTPQFQGGVMLDGNFGYNEAGQPIRPRDKLIIDHHDKFDTEAHDTATIMAFRLIEDDILFAQLEGPQFRGENGELPIITNNIDSDAITSTWIIQNRSYLRELCATDKDRYKRLKNIMERIVDSGDFLLGSAILEHGVTAREYEYIIRNYLVAAQDQIASKKREPLEAEIQELNGRRAKAVATLEGLEREQAAIIAGPGAEIASQLDEVKRRSGLDQREKGQLIRELTGRMAALSGTLPDRIKIAKDELTSVRELIAKREKELAPFKNGRLDAIDNLKALGHMHDQLIDIVENPFKYQRFMFRGFEAEARTFDAIDAAYRNGAIEIRKDSKNSEILLVTPRTADRLPTTENIDGEFFFYRSRIDFNLPLVLKMDGDSLILSINTQRKQGLNEYNFNELIDRMRQRDSEIMREKLQQGATGKERKTLERDLEANEKGRLWRSRTQMIFAFKTYIPESEIMELIRAWKKEQQKPKKP